MAEDKCTGERNSGLRSIEYLLKLNTLTGHIRHVTERKRSRVGRGNVGEREHGCGRESESAGAATVNLVDPPTIIE